MRKMSGLIAGMVVCFASGQAAGAMPVDKTIAARRITGLVNRQTQPCTDNQPQIRWRVPERKLLPTSNSTATRWRGLALPDAQNDSDACLKALSEARHGLPPR